MSWAITGKDFKFFHGPNKAILELKNQKWVQKLTIFDQIDIHILVILVVKKVVFWTFLKLFRKFLSIVFRYLYSFPSHSRPSPLGSRGCPTLRKIRRILIIRQEIGQNRASNCLKCLKNWSCRIWSVWLSTLKCPIKKCLTQGRYLGKLKGWS